MPLNLTGPISIGGPTVGQSINLELGRLATATSSLNETDLRTLAGVLSGAISMNTFYGKSSVSIPGEVWEVVRSGTNYASIVWTGTQYVAPGFNSISTSLDAINWTLRNMSDPWSWEGIAWSGSVFVVVGNSGFIRTSTDGITWTARTSGTSNLLRGVTWSGTQFIAVGNSGTIITSPDGTTWTTRFSGTTNSLAKAVWNGSQFVAVGTFTVLTSPDGATWTTGSFGYSPNMYDIVWTGAQFVAVGQGGAIATSPNGATWTVRTSGTTSQINTVGWSGSSLMYASSSGVIRTSPDGITWTDRTSNTVSSLRSTVWDGSKFVVVGFSGQVLTSNSAVTEFTLKVSPEGLNAVAYSGALTSFLAVGGNGRVVSSFDGANWEIISQPLSGALGIAASPSTIVVVGASGGIRTSSNGVDWTVRTSGTTNTLNSVIWTGTQFVIVGAVGTIRTSPDGATWTTRTSGTTNGINRITWSGNQLVAVTATGGILTSPDGLSWIKRIDGEFLWSSTFSSTQNKHVAVGGNGTIKTSSNGEVWQNETVITDNDLRGSATNGSTFVAVGAAGFIITSTNGSSWTVRSSGTSSNQQAVTWTGTQFIAVGASGTIRTSPDGTTWTSRASGVTNTLEDVLWSGTQFIAVGQGGVVLTSPDTVTWTSRAFGITSAISGIAWSGSQFVAVASFGAVRTSPDGITWTARTSNTSATLWGVAWSGTRFIIVGDSGIIRSSSDGTSWATRSTTSGSNTSFRGITWTGSQFVVVGLNGDIHTSPDGDTWTARIHNVPLSGITWTGSQFIAGGSFGRVLTSPDAITWTTRVSGVLDNISSLSSSPDLTAFSTSASAIGTSPDGITWTNRPKSGTTAALNNSAWSGSQFVVVGNAGSIVKSGDAPGAFTAVVTPSVSSVNEGSSVTFNVVTTDLPTGTVYWTITGTATAADFSPAVSSGSINISSSIGSVMLTTLADSLTEGPETLQLQIRANSTSGPVVGTSSTVTINDTSLSPTATVTPNSTFVNEGSSVAFNVSTSGFPSGTLYWTISGTATAADFSPAVSSGSFNVSSSSGSVSLNIVNDVLTEGNENFQLQVRTSSTSGPIIGTSSTVTISDTSLSPSATVTPSTNSVNEGGIVTFNVSTSGFPSGTLYWTITGTATAADFSSSTGSFGISSSSGALIVTTLADTLTEGNETFQLQVRTGSTSGTIIGTSSTVTINDTSLTPAGAAAWSTNVITQTSTGHGTTSAGPINIWYRRSVFVVTYSSAEIQAAFGGKTSATITGLRFSVTNQPLYQPLPTYAIGMKLTTNTITSNNSSTSGGTFTLVKGQASESFSAGTVKEFVLSPFNWNSGQNLVVSFAWGQCPTNYNGSGTVPTGTGTSWYSQTDSAGTYLITDSTSSAVSYRPVIQLFG